MQRTREPLKMTRPACCLLAMGLLAAVSAPAPAQSMPGAPGERSRSVIRISVSVAPAFKREAVSPRPGAAGGPAITAVDPSLRYALVTLPIDDGPSSGPGERSVRSGTLVLVVPD